MAPRDAIRIRQVLRCPACGGAGRQTYREVRDYVHQVGDRWSFDRCDSCGLLWLNPRPVADDHPLCYPAEYFTHTDGETGHSQQRHDAWWTVLIAKLEGKINWGILSERYGYRQLSVGARWRTLGRIASLLPPLRHNAAAAVMCLPRGAGRIVDIGCGEGTFLAWMESLGWKVTGVEPDPLAARRAAARIRGPVLETTIERADLPPETFDAVTMSHVIEHLSDPAPVLRKAHDILKPTGYLIVATPNAQSLGHRVYRQFWRHLDPPRHQLVFTFPALRGMIEDAGFSIAHRATLTRTAWWVAAQSRAARAGGPIRPPRELSPGSRTRAFAVMETALSLVFPAIGEELLVMARKAQRR